MFRTVTHQTLGDYIRQRRLLLAAVELRTTERPIFDIAMDLGYVSQQTFSAFSVGGLIALPAIIATACSFIARALTPARVIAPSIA